MRTKSVGALGALLLSSVFIAPAAPALAELKVAASIAPVHSLVARVMQGVGEPGLIVRPGASPHGYAMKPSEARTLSEAKVVFWIGEALEPWMERPLDALAEGAKVVELSEVPGVEKLEIREGGVWAEHDHSAHGGHDDHGDDHGHDHGAKKAKGHDHDHDHDHGAKKAKAHDHDHDHDHGAKKAKGHDHDHDHDHGAKEAKADGHDDHDHAHGDFDPHLWLDPENAKVWVTAIAAALSEKDPKNAAAYAENAKAARAELDALSAEIRKTLEPARGKGYVVFHDAYHYFEHRFDIEASGSIALSDATAPGPKRLREIRAEVKSREATCVFSEPQFQPKLVSTVIDGTGARTAELDPIGANLKPGPALYPTLLKNLASSMAGCLGG